MTTIVIADLCTSTIIIVNALSAIA